MERHQFQPYPKSRSYCGVMIDNYARCAQLASADIHAMTTDNIEARRERTYCPSCNVFCVLPNHCDNCGGDLVIAPELPNTQSPDAQSECPDCKLMGTVDICDTCGEDFGLSGEDGNGYNSTCVHCGNNTYTTRPCENTFHELQGDKEETQCGVSNPSGTPCTKDKGHAARGDVHHDIAAHGPQDHSDGEEKSVNENQTPRDGSSGTLRAAQGDGVAGERPDNLYDGAVSLLRSWLAWFDSRPAGWASITISIVTNTRALLIDEAARQESAWDTQPTSAVSGNSVDYTESSGSHETEVSESSSSSSPDTTGESKTRTEIIREQQRSGGGEITAVMVSLTPSQVESAAAWRPPKTLEEFLERFNKKYPTLPLWDTVSCKFYVQRALRFVMTNSVDIPPPPQSKQEKE